MVYNWGHAASVLVDVSGSLAIGAPYEVRSALDFNGASVARGIYDGKPISLPMTGLQAVAPIGQSTASSPAPEFGAFVLLSSNVAPTAAPGRLQPNLSGKARGRNGREVFRPD